MGNMERKAGLEDWVKGLRETRRKRGRRDNQGYRRGENGVSERRTGGDGGGDDGNHQED